MAGALDRRETLGLTAAAFGFASPDARAQETVKAPTMNQSDDVKITRHFVTVGNRQVHYRRAGSGPAVILLHASPGSSASMVSFIRRLAGRFTVIAPDTPGNGLSDPLPLAQPAMADYADALAALLTALGLDRAAVYGSYTGAGCALEMSRLHPNRVTQVIVNGYLQFTDAERAEILANYLPVFAADWYGGHLIWAWARMREQLIFFPWFHKDDASRMDTDLPNPAGLHRGVVDLMRSGDNYRNPYRSAFALDYAASLLTTKAPTTITTSKQDVMWPHMARMPKPPANVTVHGTETRDHSWEIAVAALDKETAQSVPTAPHSKPIPGRIWCDMLQIDGVSIYARRNTDAKGRPILFIHDTGGSSLQSDEFMIPFIGKRPVLAIDLPGNGESENSLGDKPTVAGQAAFLATALDAEGHDSVDVIAVGGGCAVAVELAAAHPKRVKNLVLRRILCLDPAGIAAKVAELIPELQPRAHGSHLLSAWNYVRDVEMFSPWHVRSGETALRGEEPDLDPSRVQVRALDVIKCADIHPALVKAHDGYPMAETLAKLTCKVVLDRPENASTVRAAAVVPKGNATVADLHRRDPGVMASRLLPVLT